MPSSSSSTVNTTLTVHAITAADLTTHPHLLHRMSHVHLTSFLTNAVYSSIYPGGYSEDIVGANMNRHQTCLTTDPTARYLVVSSTSPSLEDESALISLAKFHVFPTRTAQDSCRDTTERTWPPGTNVGLVRDFWSQIQSCRNRWGPRLGAHVQLDLLATAPEFQGRGAGGLLVAAVADVCDQRQIPGFLEASPEGLGVYLKHGWQDTGERVRVDLERYRGGMDKGEDWREREGIDGDRGWYENVVMVRPVKGKTWEDYLHVGT